jgi:hypothetical protein
MPTPITRFKCDFCKRHYSTKPDAVKHEKLCLKNPANKSCSTCNNTFIDTCSIDGKKIYVNGNPIRNCEDWKEIEFAENEDTEDF